MKILIVISILMLCGCSFSVKNCELEPGADIKGYQKDKPIQDQVTPKAEVSCSY